MSQEYVFTPNYGTAITVAPTTTSASSQYGRGSKQLVISNIGAVSCYVTVGTGSASASNADYIVLANSQVPITKDKSADYVAYTSASGTGALHIISGEGF